jgi:CBS-domain-containing membrane protein
MEQKQSRRSALERAIALLLQGTGGFIAIYCCMAIGGWTEVSLLMAPFGASCVLAFALPDSPLAQPRSIVGGHALSTVIGLALLHTAGLHAWSAALGVALAIVCMQLTRTLHPPAGADPLLVMLSGAGWSFLWTPALLGSALIVGAAYGFHRVCRRRYPQRWL